MESATSTLIAAAALTGFGLSAISVIAQTELLSIEFVADDQAGFDLWPSAYAGTSSTANFTTDPVVTSGTTTVTLTTSSGFGTPGNRGSSDGNPAGYSYQHLYEDLLIATTPTGALTLDFSGLNPAQAYVFTLYAWDPGATDPSDKAWTVTGGTGAPSALSVNFQDPLVDNESFALVFEITTTATGTFQLTNTAGLPQSAINGFTLAVESVDPDQPPTITSQPQGIWDGGEEIVIEVGVSGAVPLGYQWYLDGAMIVGANSESLVLTAAEWVQEGDYTVRVTNANGSVESDVAVVTIDIPVFPTREELTYEPPGPASRRSGIAISEILYHPAQRMDTREIEFVELYNSHPWRQDLAGWRLSGDIAFTFPNGASVPAQGYLVVARIPTDVEAEFGIANVQGPWTNNLPNEGGRIRLRKPSGAIVQEVNYNDRGPWPAAADGAGHSLILARPSYGEDDSRAWAPSHSIGGSPGEADPIPSGDLDHVFVSGVLSNSDLPLEDYLELRNAAPFAVILSGCTLSDARDTRALFTIPPATSIPAHGTLRFVESELGFALDSQGDAVYLTDPSGTRVLDAVLLPAAATDVPFARVRSDAPLRAMSVPQVVINELMFHAPTHDDADEWIEIHHRGAGVQDLTGWAFTDGITFAFPDGAQIAAGGFLVIAKDRARTLTNHPSLDPTLVLGNYSGSLSDAGERVELSRPDDGALAPEDAIAYVDSDRWHRFADGRGATLERVDTGGDSLAPSNWVDSDESAKAAWTTVEYFGTLAFGNASAPANQVQMFLLGAGEALVDQVEVLPRGRSNIVPNGNFESGTSGWFFQGNHRRSTLEVGGAFEGANSLRLVATKRGDTGPNRARAPLTQTLAAGSRATLRARVRWLAGHPEFIIRLKGNWLEATGRLELPTNLGTPGAANSHAVANAGPHIDLVTHRPLLPRAGESIDVFAQVADANGVGSVTLRYRIDPSTTLTDLPMRDDGLGADLSPGDGIFSATVPAQSGGALVAFQIIARDADAAPAESVFPPAGECLARVGDPAGGPSFGTYRMWITQAALADWDAQPFRSNDPFPITFIYNDARAIYAAGAYYGGNKDSHSHPLSGSVSYDVVLPSNEEILGANKLTFDYPVRDVTNQREQLMHWFADQLHLPTLHRRDIYLYMNGIRRRSIYHDAEQPDAVVVNSHFPGDKGELFKTSNDNETTDRGSRIRPFVRNVIDVFEVDGRIREARYRWTTGARARGSRTRLDDSSIVDLMQRADDTGPDYGQRLLEIIDMDNWMRTFALIDLASYWDAFGNPNWKNTYLYKPDGGKWVQFTWDFDVGLGVFNDPTNQALFPGNVDANIRRMYQTPAFVRSYWRAMDQSLGTFFSSRLVRRILEEKRRAYAAAGLGFTSPFSPSGPYNLSVPSWIDQRAAFIQPQLNAVNVPFEVLAPANGSSTGEQTITLSGTAPVSAAAIEVNGIALEPAWASVGSWSAPFVLQPGPNLLVVRALGSEGTEIASETRTVTFTGNGGWPALVINEWMASNQTALADPADGDFDDWIELFNPTATPADLEGWFLSDDPLDPYKFQIPAGFSIPVGGFLLVWADNEPTQNDLAVHRDLHAAFQLAAGGEGILLSAPDGNLIDGVDFGQQSADKTMGRADDQIVALAAPSPDATNGRAAVDPVATFTIDGSTLSFTVVAEPGFRYEVETSEDLLTWESLGNILAEGNTIEFTDSVDRTRLFYRFRRTP
ncbi:MAG: lamin tail domain-containing protein [Roseibacillus sp.]